MSEVTLGILVTRLSATSRTGEHEVGGWRRERVGGTGGVMSGIKKRGTSVFHSAMKGIQFENEQRILKNGL